MTTRDDLLALLAAAPARLAAAAAGVAPDLLRRPPAEGEWSAVEVLAHLRACADVWGGCVATLLAADEPTIRAVNPRTYVERTDYPSLDFATSLAAFTAQRDDLLRTLTALADADWTRAATVTGAGRPLRRTVLSYVEWLATHERTHVKQVERAVRAVSGS